MNEFHGGVSMRWIGKRPQGYPDGQGMSRETMCLPVGAGSRMAKMMAANPHCQREGSPMVRINGRWECAAEYLDRCLDGKRVVDAVQLKGVVSHYVFEDGHKLPLLCFCCGEPLDTVDPKCVRASALGRRLEAMSLAMVSMEDGRALLLIQALYEGVESKKGGSSPLFDS